MYPPAPTAMFDRAGPRWAEGMSSWTQDYPRADRHFLQALRRLTRIHARSVEQPVNLDDGDDVYNWPWLYAVRPGEWQLTDAQAHKLRDYLLRGGFFMADDFWGTPEWAVFWDSMRRVFPDRQAVELDNDNAIFHTIYDLDDRYQVPGAWGLYGRGYQNDGRVAALERHLRRQGPVDGCHHSKLRPRRFLGVGRRAANTRNATRRLGFGSA